jgi:hypothetical protein
VISARGGGHELQFDPLAAFFECAEISPTLHSPAPDSSRKHERRDRGAAPFLFYSLYLVYQFAGGKVDMLGIFIFGMLSSR